MSIHRTPVDSASRKQAVAHPEERFDAIKEQALRKGADSSFEIAAAPVDARKGNLGDTPAAQFAAGPGRWTAMLRNTE